MDMRGIVDANSVHDNLEHGVRIAPRFAGLLAGEDLFSEFLQEAWLRYLSRPDEQSDPVRCGKAAANAFMRRWNRDTDHVTASCYNDALEAESLRVRELRFPMPEYMRERLLDEFRAQRKKKGDRGEAAAARDVEILDLLWQGYRDREICQSMSISYWALRTYRRQLKIRLEHMLERVQQSAGDGNRYVAAWAAGNFQPKPEPKPAPEPEYLGPATIAKLLAGIEEDECDDECAEEA